MKNLAPNNSLRLLVPPSPSTPSCYDPFTNCCLEGLAYQRRQLPRNSMLMNYNIKSDDDT